MSLTLTIAVTSVGIIVGLIVGQKQKISFTYKNIHCVKGLDNLYHISISDKAFKSKRQCKKFINNLNGEII